MTDFIIKEVTNKNIKKELEYIGFDSSYCEHAAGKFKYKNIKIFNLNPAQANILKQTALSVGADCGTNKNVITGSIDISNVILGGSYNQIINIAKKLKFQPFNLKILSENLIKFLNQTEKETKIIGILNVTPDSFSDGGLNFKPDDAIKHLQKLINDGADGIDIGAESTRPYSMPVSDDEQIKRLNPVLEFIQNEKINLPISIDTRSSIVASYVIDKGIKIINDVSGLEYDSNMYNVISGNNTKIIIQHSLGNPENMQDNPTYNNVVEEIYLSLLKKIELANSKGITDIIIDPGIGFGKTKEDNFEILNRIEEFYSLGYPIMIGLSRKSFLGIKENDNNIKDALSAAVSYPLLNKVDYLRVHNVKLYKYLLNLNS